MRTSWTIFPGSASIDGSSTCDCRLASARSAVRASSGPKISVCRHVISVSRPNTVMNHGMPAAGSLPMSPSARMRSAARSLTERRNAWLSVSQLAFTCGTLEVPGGERVADVRELLAERRAGRCGRARTVEQHLDHELPPLAARRARPSRRRSSRSWRPGCENSTCVRVVAVGEARASRRSSQAAGGRRRQRLRVLGVAEREVVLLDREDVREVAAELERRPRSAASPSTRCGSRSAPAASRRRSASARSRARPAAARPAGCGGRRRPRSTRPGPTRAAAAAGR